jgi:hypothetical protein
MGNSSNKNKSSIEQNSITTNKFVKETDYQKYFRNPNHEIIPLLLATTYPHPFLEDFPIDLLKRVQSFLYDTKVCSF